MHMWWAKVHAAVLVYQWLTELNNNNNDRLTAFDPGQPG